VWLRREIYGFNERVDNEQRLNFIYSEVVTSINTSSHGRHVWVNSLVITPTRRTSPQLRKQHYKCNVCRDLHIACFVSDPVGEMLPYIWPCFSWVHARQQIDHLAKARIQSDWTLKEHSEILPGERRGKQLSQELQLGSFSPSSLSFWC
jgi:hypothetical protein